MAKRMTYALLVALGFITVGSFIGLYLRHQAWLRASGLDGAVFIGLIIFGISALLMPFHLRSLGEQATAGDMAREFFLRGGMILGGLLGIFLLFTLIIALISLPAYFGYPQGILLWLTLLVPLVSTGIDIYNGKYARTLPNVGWGFLLYFFRIYGLLLIQLIAIPIAFILFPAGFFIQLLSLFDWVMHQFGMAVDEQTILCQWAQVEPSACVPLLITFHGGHLLLVIGVSYIGPKLFDVSADSYHAVMEWLAARLEP